MNNKAKVLAIFVIAFFAGCFGGPTLEALVVPPLSAQQVAAGVTRWEYRCVPIQGRQPPAVAENATTLSNQLGAEGWEMGGALGLTVCFKRPLH